MNSQSKITGIVLLLLYVCITTALLNDAFIGPFNLQNLVRYISLFGIIGVGAVFVIVTGGIDLSIGSVVGLTGCILTLTLNRWIETPSAVNVGFVGKLLSAEAIAAATIWSGCLLLRWRRSEQPATRRERTWIAGLVATGLLGWLAALGITRLEFPSWVTILVCLGFALAVAMHLGWFHGVLITKLKLQPFVVTLCGLMCYRGISRWLADDKTQGFGTKYDESLRLLAIGKPCTASFVMLVGGLALATWGAVKVCFGDPEQRRSRRIWGITLIAMGVILTLVSSAKYWDGWTVKSSATLLSLGTWEWKTWSVTVPNEAQARPIALMKFAVYPLIAASASLLVVLSRRWIGERNIRAWLGAVVVPTGLAAISAVALYWIKAWIGDSAVTLQSSDPAARWQMLAVFAAMAGLMIGISVIASAVLRGKRLGEQVILASAAYSAVLWLLSFTAIHNTKVQFPFFVLLGVGLAAGVFLNQTIYGRYLFALGRNEEAARFSGINTDRMIVLAYVICAACAGLGGILFTLDSNNVEPSGHGSFYELYAIAAAVLGGCSLRGGEGSVIGVILGAAIMRVLFNAPNMIGFPQQLELFTMGTVILIGVITDEQIRRLAARRLRTAR